MVSPLSNSSSFSTVVCLLDFFSATLLIMWSYFNCFHVCRQTFANNLLSGASVEASSTTPGHAAQSVLDGNVDTYWEAQDDGSPSNLTFTISSVNSESTFNVISVQEYIPEGQVVAQHSVEVYTNGKWSAIAQGTTVGNKRLHRLSSAMPLPKQMRVVFSKTMFDYPPRISQVGLFYAKPITDSL